MFYKSMLEMKYKIRFLGGPQILYNLIQQCSTLPFVIILEVVVHVVTTKELTVMALYIRVSSFLRVYLRNDLQNMKNSIFEGLYAIR